jgi:drug/metabolite transporter (DMT)-like permease
MSKDLTTRLPVPDYLACRFLAAAAFLVVVRPRALGALDRSTVVRGATLGALYALGQLLQFVGLQSTAPTVSAFVVSMYVVLTPVVAAVVHRRRPGGVGAAATMLATAGLAVLALRGWSFGGGETLILVASLVYAVHILALGTWSDAATAYSLTFVQLLTMGLLLLVAAAPGGVAVPAPHDWPTFLYLALLAGGAALLVQTRAQAHLPPATVAVILVLEPVWAAVFGRLLWHEALDGRTVLGGALVVAAMLLVVAGGAARPVAPDGMMTACAGSSSTRTTPGRWSRG